MCIRDSVQAVELLPYHRLGKNKYALLGRAYALESLGPMSKEDLARRAAFVAERDVYKRQSLVRVLV